MSGIATFGRFCPLLSTFVRGICNIALYQGKTRVGQLYRYCRDTVRISRVRPVYDPCLPRVCLVVMDARKPEITSGYSPSSLQMCMLKAIGVLEAVAK